MNQSLPNKPVDRGNSELGKLELENKIKAMHNFRTALRSGTFSGNVAHHIAALANLLDNEHDAALKEYEAQLAIHPEWGRPKELAPAATA